MDDKLKDDLVAIDRALGQAQISGTLEQRILRLAEVPHASLRWPLLAASLVAAVFASIALWPASPNIDAPKTAHAGLSPTAPPKGPPEQASTPPEPPQVSPEHRRWANALHLQPDCRPTGDVQLQVPTDCKMTLQDPALRVHVLADAQVRPARRGVGIDAGIVMVSVDHVDDPRDPVRIEVLGGAVEVTGTRFLVVQGVDEGYVHLIEGSITFVPKRGKPVEATIGEPLHWDSQGLRPTGKFKRPSRPHRAPSTKKAVPEQLNTLLDEVAALRRREEYTDAVSMLRRARARTHKRQTREILSFEEGTLLEFTQRDPTVCSFWRGHLARFDKGHYTQAIERRMADLACRTTTQAVQGRDD